MSDRKSTTRRDALAALGASASALVTAGAVLARTGGGARARSSSPAKVAPTGADAKALEAAAAHAELAELLGDVRVGTRLARCRVVEILPIQMGALPIVMETRDGRRFQLDVLRDDGRVGAVGRAPGLAVFVSNGGDGGTPTDEAQGLAAMALGDVLSRRLREGARVPALLTSEERQARFPNGTFHLV